MICPTLYESHPLNLCYYEPGFHPDSCTVPTDFVSVLFALGSSAIVTKLSLNLLFAIESCHIATDFIMNVLFVLDGMSLQQIS